MTVQSVARYTATFIGDGVQTTYPFGFRVLSASDVAVVEANMLLPNSAYSVTGVGNPNGGTIIKNQPLVAGVSLVIFAETSLDQEIGYPEGSTFPASSHELGLDRGAMVAIETRDTLELVPQLPRTVPAAQRNMQLPLPVALQLIGWNAAANGYTNFPSTLQQVTPAPVSGYVIAQNPTIAVPTSDGVAQLSAVGALLAGTETIAVAARIDTPFSAENGLTGVKIGYAPLGEDVFVQSMAITPADTISNIGTHIFQRRLFHSSSEDVTISALGGPFGATGQISITAWSLSVTPP